MNKLKKVVLMQSLREGDILILEANKEVRKLRGESTRARVLYPTMQECAYCWKKHSNCSKLSIYAFNYKYGRAFPICSEEVSSVLRKKKGGRKYEKISVA